MKLDLIHVVSVGRKIMKFVPYPISNDIYTHMIGVYAIGGSGYLVYYVIKQAFSQHFRVFIQKMFTYLIIVRPLFRS